MTRFSLREKVLVACIVCLLATVTFAFGYTGNSKKRQGWLLSQGAIIQLGVWDKGGEYGGRAYEATFIVTAPNGKKATAEAIGSDDWIYVNFPDDFEGQGNINYSKLTNYKWVCVVKGKTVASGSFQWGNSTAAIK